MSTLNKSFFLFYFSQWHLVQCSLNDGVFLEMNVSMTLEDTGLSEILKYENTF